MPRAPNGNAMQHWTSTRDADGLARLARQGRTPAPTRSARRCSPSSTRRSTSSTAIRRSGLVIASGKANGFIAGADVDEFAQSRTKPARWRSSSAAGTRSSGSPRVGYPTARADSRLLPGRRAGAGARLPLPRRRRRAGHPPGPARGDAGDRARLGRHQAAAAACRRAGGARPDADRPHDRCAQGEAARHRRRMRAGADHGEHRARHPERAAGAATRSASRCR